MSVSCVSYSASDKNITHLFEHVPSPRGELLVHGFVEDLQSRQDVRNLAVSQQSSEQGYTGCERFAGFNADSCLYLFRFLQIAIVSFLNARRLG